MKVKIFVKYSQWVFCQVKGKNKPDEGSILRHEPIGKITY